MITIDFSLAIGLVLLAASTVLLIAWVGGRRLRDRQLTLNPRHIWHCSICAHTYINTKEETITVCPKCASYNKR